MLSAQANKINHAIQQASHILIVIHQKPDADALGSFVAVSEWLKKLGKEHLGFCRDTALADCSFIGEQRQLLSQPEQVLNETFDTIVVLDSGDLQFAGFDDILPQLKTKPTIINIDHHITNQGYGQINLVEPTAAATAEILYQLFRHLAVTINPRMASALLAGIINDTFGFTNPNTSAKSLAAASALLRHGAKLNQVSDALLKNKSVKTLQLWGTILERLYLDEERKIATTVITADDLDNDPTQIEFTEGISNFLNNLSGVNASLVLRQDSPDTVKGSLRTNRDDVDVAKLASLLGGGGHRKAAGFKIKGKLIRNQDGSWQII